jgi:glutathione S-transferase
MQYKLFGTPGSPFSYFVHATLVHKGVDFSYEFMNIKDGETRQREFTDMNPFGQVPVLVCSSENEKITLFESWSIYEYLEDVYPLKPLLPVHNPERAFVRALAHSLITEFVLYPRLLFLEKIGVLQHTDEFRAKYKKLAYEKISVFENQIQNLILNCNSFNAFDALFFPAWHNLEFAVPEVATDFPQLKAYHQQLSKNECIQKVESHPAVIKIRELFANPDCFNNLKVNS